MAKKTKVTRSGNTPMTPGQVKAMDAHCALNPRAEAHFYFERGPDNRPVLVSYMLRNPATGLTL